MLASGTAHAVERLPWDDNLRITDLQQESFTVAWDARADVEFYRASVQVLEACDDDYYRSADTEGLTAAFSGLTPDCPYRISVVAVLTATPVYLNPIARIEVTTPLPDGYVSPEAPSNLRAELIDGEAAGFTWDPANVSVDPVKYRIYMEPVLQSNPFDTVTETSFDGPSFDYFLITVEAGGFSTVRVWVTTVDGIHNESAPSNEVVLSCQPDRIRGASCVPA